MDEELERLRAEAERKERERLQRDRQRLIQLSRYLRPAIERKQAPFRDAKDSN